MDERAATDYGFSWGRNAWKTLATPEDIDEN